MALLTSLGCNTDQDAQKKGRVERAPFSSVTLLAGLVGPPTIALYPLQSTLEHPEQKAPDGDDTRLLS